MVFLKQLNRKQLPDLIEKGMEKVGGGKVTRVEEPLFAGANGALRSAKRMPERYWQIFR